MDAIVQWFTVTLEPFVSKEAAVFIISLFPILELRGGRSEEHTSELQSH